MAPKDKHCPGCGATHANQDLLCGECLEIESAADGHDAALRSHARKLLKDAFERLAGWVAYHDQALDMGAAALNTEAAELDDTQRDALAFLVIDGARQVFRDHRDLYGYEKVLTRLCDTCEVAHWFLDCLDESEVADE